MPVPVLDVTRLDRQRQAAMVEPAWYFLPLDHDSVAHYGRRLGFQHSAMALKALAQAIASSAGWPAAARAMIVCRSNPRPLMAVWGRFGAGDQGGLKAQAEVLDSVCRHVRYIRYEEAAEATERLATRLHEHLGRDQIERARFNAIPRGGLVVLGLLAVILGLKPEQLEAPRSPDELLVVVDDCVLSGTRSAQALERYGSQRVVFAHLFSHPELRSVIAKREPRVVACLAAHELAERGDEEPSEGWRQRWSERSSDKCYWIGRPEPLCFPWGEPDRAVWNPIRERVERAWRVVPPRLCLKNRPPADADSIRIQMQPESRASLRPTDRVLYGELDDSIVLGNFANGESFVLAGVAADIWRSIGRCGGISSVVADLAGEYETPGRTLHRDVQAFVAKLTDQGLLQDLDSITAGADQAPSVRDELL